MTRNKVVVLLLSLVLLLGFTAMSFASTTGKAAKVVKTNTVKNGHFETTSVQGKDARETRRLTKQALKNKLSKQEVINRNNNRNALSAKQELRIPLIQDVPGGSDIFSVWSVTFDSEDDFNTFTPVDLLGNGNDWMWLDYVNFMGWGEDYIDNNSAFAPEPGGDFGGDVVAKDEAIDIKVGVPKMSEGGDPYRVSNLLLELYLSEPDVDDEFWVEILEPAKWHVTNDADPVWAMHSDQVYETEGQPGYDDDMVEDLISKPIAIPAGATLSFVHAIASEDQWDGGNVKVSTDDGATWEVIVPDEGYDDDDLFAFKFHGAYNIGLTDADITDADPEPYSQPGFTGVYGGYQAVHFDLSAYEGQTIMIKWQFAADHYTTVDDGGWWIDDIVVANGETVFENHGEDNGDLTAVRHGLGFIGEPWVALAGWAGYDYTALSVNIDVTNNIIGAPGDSFTVRFRAIYDDNDEGTGKDPNWGFEVSAAALEVYTRYAHDIGVTFVDLDSTLTNNGSLLVGEAYDPQVVVSNFGLNDYTIYNTFVKIQNTFGTTVYERYIYTYAPGQGDTLAMFPGEQAFNDDMGFYNFPDWTPEFEGDYTLTAYTEVFGGDDMASDDSLVVNFHVYTETPVLVENFNTMTDAELYANWTYAGADSGWFIGDLFGNGDNELWFFHTGGTWNDAILTPPIDCSALTGVAVSFEQHVWTDYDPTFEAHIVVATDGGHNLTSLKTLTAASTYDERHGFFTIDLSEFADGQSNFQFGFTFKSDQAPDGPNGYEYMTIDDLVIFPGADLTGPETPANLAVAAGDMAAPLSWDAVAGTAYYDVYVSDTDDFATAGVVAQVKQSPYTDNGLTNGETYFYWVTAVDFNNNQSAPAGPVETTPADVTAPTKITDLHASDMPGENSKLITWTAPTETAPEEGTTYDIRYAYMPVTDATWDMAYVLEDVPDVAAAGTEQTLVIPVDRMHDYVFDVYFAIKTTDSDGNVSAISNPAHADDIKPGTVSDLAVTEVTETSVTLGWTAVGDDGVIAGGPAWSYEIRVAYGEFDAETFDWETAAVLPGVPDPSAPAEKESYTATEYVYPTSTRMTFALVVVDWNGNMSMVSNVAVSLTWEDIINGVEEESKLPEEFALAQNYPNPFNPSTAISFELPKATHVKLEVWSTTGQKITTLVDGQFSAGSHNVHWNAVDSRGMKVASGVYFYRLETPEFTNIKKMTLMK